MATKAPKRNINKVDKAKATKKTPASVKAPPDNHYTVLCSGVECPVCKEVVVSLGVHDFNRCECGDVFVDGGFDYLRVGYNKVSPKTVRVRLTKEYLTRFLKRDII